jgi:hypothetical protein
MRIIKNLTLIASLLAPQAAFTADLTVRVDGIIEYDDNVFRDSRDEDDDVLFRLRPGVKVHEDRGEDLRWSLDYEVPFEFAADHGDELDDIDHRAGGRFTYRANERLELFASDEFRYLRGALRDVQADDVVSGEGTVLINQNRDRVTINDAEAGLSYQFTPRLTGTARAGHTFFDPDRDDRAENWLLSTLADVSYVLTPRHSVGMGVQYFRQEFDDRTNVVGSTANSYNAFLQWTYRVDETLSLSIAGGPTYIEVDQDDAIAAAAPPAIPAIPLAAGTDVTGFGLLRRNGAAAAGPLPANALVVSQLPACSTLSSGTPVFTGTVCPLGSSATTAGIVLDSVNDPVQFAAASALVPVTNPFPDGEDDSSLDFFAEAVIAKHWTENLHSALRYRRTQGGASGLGGTVVRDTINLANTWDLTERWQLALRGDWSLRQSVTESTGQFLVASDASASIAGFAPGLAPAGADSLVTVRGEASEIDTMRYGGSARLTHRLFRNTSAWVQLTYNEQDSQSDSLGNPSDFENFLASFGVRHVFEPIKLW